MEKIILKDKYTPEEIRENRAIWVRNLRSGEFAQGHGQLRSSDGGYCCLGVLTVSCEGVVAEKQNYEQNDGTMVASYFFTDGSTEDGVLRHYGASTPVNVMDAVGLRVASGQYGTPDPEDEFSRPSLWNLNDVKRITFLEIADVIESEPEGMFK